MKLRTKRFIPIVIIFLVLSPFYFQSSDVSCQANLVENEDYFKIYAGNNYNLIVPKETGPDLTFEADTIGDVNVKLEYLSEFDSPTSHLNSLSYLSDKGYSFETMNWDIYGVSDQDRAYVNFTKDFLDRNATIDFSVVVFDNNYSVDGYEIRPLQTAYLELAISNWSFSPNVDGIALNIVTLIESSKFERLGPFADFVNGHYVVELFGSDYKFELRFRELMWTIDNNGHKEPYLVRFFADYNVMRREPNPADFWVSIPYSSDISKIILDFVCNIYPLQTSSASIKALGLLFVSMVCLVFPFKWFSSKDRRKRI